MAKKKPEVQQKEETAVPEQVVQAKEIVITSKPNNKTSLTQFHEHVSKMIQDFGGDAVITEVRLVIVKIENAEPANG